jgi:deoxyribonuclease-2
MLAINPARRLAIVALCCVICLCAGASPAESRLSCLDEQGNPVDWYMGYKFPKMSGDDRFETGRAYAYITDKDVSESPNGDIETKRKIEDPESLIFLRQFKDLLVKFGGTFKNSPSGVEHSRLTRSKRRKLNRRTATRWEASNLLVDDPGSSIMRTLAPAYDPKLFNQISSIFYNDDPPHHEPESKSGDFEYDGDSDWQSDDEQDEMVVEEKKQSRKKIKNSKRAHAKGVLLMDETSNTGVWLTHSVPRFPSDRDHIMDYPDSGKIYGQTFMCITFSLDSSGEQLINHLANMRPIVYDRKITSSLEKQFPGLKSLIDYHDSKFKKVPDQDRLAQMITTKGGQVVKLYSKSPSVQEDLYGWIDRDLGSSLYVETWRRNGGVLNSSCPPNDYHINNVKDLKYNDELKWEYSQDHSKYAITENEDTSTVCIGDSNRTFSQFSRGSGAICIRCPTCWMIFSKTILDVEPCVSLAARIEKYLKATRQS